MLVKLNVRNNISYDKEVMDAFRRGLEKHNIKPTTSSGEYDLSVQWGHKRIPKDSKDYLVIERGYYNDRFKHYSVGYNGLNGEADFVNFNSDNKRWKHDHLIQPWQDNKDGYVLIIGQTPGDASLNSKALPKVKIDIWISEQKEKYEAMGHRAKVRNHPNVCPPTRSLQEDFAGAKLVVTCSSNTGVESVMAGIPTVADYPCSMVYKLCRDTATPNREQWLQDLAYCQWDIHEIRSGEAWEHLRRKYG